MNLFKSPSESFRTINPHLFGVPNCVLCGKKPHPDSVGHSYLPPDHKDYKNALQGNVAHRRGIRKGMNKTERDFSLILAAQLVKGEISGWMYEGVKLKIGEGCWYCPDFVVFTPRTERSRCIGEADTPMLASVRFIEVKGFLRDDARVKFLAAQEQHKWATFEMWRKSKQGWTQIL